VLERLTKGWGGVPWPLVKRSRFVRELAEQGAAYRQNVYAAERDTREVQRKLALAEDEFRQTLMALSGWHEGDTFVSVATEDGSPPKHFNMKMVRDYRGLRHTFAFDISDAMAMQMIKTLAPQQAKMMLTVIAERLVAQAMVELFEEGGKW